MSKVVIPIQAEGACAGRPELKVVVPVLEGDTGKLNDVLAAVKRQVDAEFDTDLPEGAWLRGLRLQDGEAEMQLAPELACKGFTIAAIAFDTMRQLLPDTDIYVGSAPA